MTKVFISHSYQDKKFVNQLTTRLREDGIQVWTNEKELAVGDNIQEKISDAIKKTDYFIVVLSKNSTNSNWVNFELSATRLKEISQEQNIILPVLIEDCEIPFSLRDRLYSDFRQSFEEGYFKLINALKTQTTKKYQETDRVIDKFKPESYEFQIKNLKDAYNNGNLTLFCGAGISYDAGIPTWNTLLKSLLKAVYSDNHDVPDLDTRLANLFQKRINVSPLILAQYLKTLLGKKFTSTVRDTLYKDCNDKSKIVDSISELSRQKRNRKPLKAIITFNFDDLIEEKLTKEKIDFKTIFTEGERYKEEEIPIYHPHGFLPRSKNLTSKNDVVFSEDAYHSQFIDPFSWSNLVQLNHLNNSTCLFIGISLTDPNMRRLLDVSIRKNGKGEKNHYIIKKRYTIEELYPESEIVKLKDKKVIPVIESIEEQDANNLGFNVIWINQFKEIPEILNEIGRY
ncbi:MAG TPA: TIR domain-containing protein [Bacteroidales bacterium]|nr:TIR domain-containing protein [Bacteroidales bacterium]HOU96514.1 TIR domain-containing protein [Bacteroidales bacterium]HQG36872.1 TIR domain-containing protein [Bacteroidales bacterium]HQG53447.1 TIR domain-containing protein [Bacteroidales bacterium]HQJ21321.1 TIR domain-containing protein [Bacteroidales bacterium]